jgi:hypothetical protein
MHRMRRHAWAILFALAALALFLGAMAQPVLATQEPANKVSAAGSETEVIGANQTEVILSEKVKTSKPSDLILGVTLECAITTELTTVGDDTETATSEIRVWVEIDGKPVPVSQADADRGQVVFCNRTDERQTTLGGDDTSDSIRTFLEERLSNGFNWMALNVGSATHEIVVKASLMTTETAGANAIAVIGNRTLIVEPTMSANREEVTQLG